MSGWGLIYDNMMSGLQNHSQMLSRIQEQIASGKRVLRASDSPTDTFQILSLQSQGLSLDTYTKNIARLSVSQIGSFDALNSLKDILVSVKVQITAVSSDTYSQEQRAVAGSLINELLKEAIGLANREESGQYLFSGDSTTVTPYVAEITGNKITSVTYQGSVTTNRVPVAPGIDQQGRLIGDEVFRNDNRQAPQFYGDTGAKAGVGTSTVRGDVWLAVTHDTTTFTGTTGIAAGTSSALGDTIIGTSYKLTIDRDNSKVKLDNGAFVTYNIATDNNLRLQNSAGEVVYVDVTGLVGTGTVVVDLTATGKLSIDGGATTVNLTAFSNSEKVTDPKTGRILYVDATAITKTGVEPVRVMGTYDVFAALISARDVLMNERGLSRSQQGELLRGDVYDSLDKVFNGILGQEATASGKVIALEHLANSIEDVRFAVFERQSQLQDADIIQLAIDLTKTQVFYEMVLAATAKVLKVSLLDYI